MRPASRSIRPRRSRRSSEVPRDLDLLLVMTVNPGFGGQAFIGADARQESRARGACSTRRGARAALEVDGGIARDTIGDCWRAGADTFVAGNAVFSAQRSARPRSARCAADVRGERMTVRQQWAFVGIVVLILGGGLLAATHYLGDELFPVTVGSKAPDFQATTVDGVPVTKTLADYKGQVVLLNIWATWCMPCRTRDAEHRGAARRTPRADSRSSRSASTIRASTTRSANFRDQYGLTFEILHDPGQASRRHYQTTGVPRRSSSAATA